MRHVRRSDVDGKSLVAPGIIIHDMIFKVEKLKFDKAMAEKQS